jgi:hypothetical protein
MSTRTPAVALVIRLPRPIAHGIKRLAGQMGIGGLSGIARHALHLRCGSSSGFRPICPPERRNTHEGGRTSIRRTTNRKDTSTSRQPCVQLKLYVPTELAAVVRDTAVSEGTTLANILTEGVHLALAVQGLSWPKRGCSRLSAGRPSHVELLNDDSMPIVILDETENVENCAHAEGIVIDAKSRKPDLTIT